ncbi:MAG: MFS transporter, partial [Gammaproteobacteria bacterium]
MIANLLGSIALGLFAMTVCLPSMAEWSGVFAASQAQVQLSFSAFVIGFGGAQLFYGPLSDIYGRRRVIVFGLSVAVVGSLLAMVSQSLTMLIGARLVQGAGVGRGVPNPDGGYPDPSRDFDGQGLANIAA